MCTVLMRAIRNMLGHVFVLCFCNGLRTKAIFIKKLISCNKHGCMFRLDTKPASDHSNLQTWRKLRNCIHVPDFLYVLFYVRKSVPIPVSARFKAWVCGRALAGIVGSNPTGGTDVCLLYSVCVVT
jgi:hypothetical protein